MSDHRRRNPARARHVRDSVGSTRVSSPRYLRVERRIARVTINQDPISLIDVTLIGEFDDLEGALARHGDSVRVVFFQAPSHTDITDTSSAPHCGAAHRGRPRHIGDDHSAWNYRGGFLTTVLSAHATAIPLRPCLALTTPSASGTEVGNE